MEKLRRLCVFAVMILSSLQIFGIERNDTISLNEKWLFKMMKCESEVPAGFQSATFNDSQWLFMAVPGQWDNQRLPKDWKGLNHVGIYRGWVKFLPKWKNRKIVLHLGNTTSEAAVYVNGEEIGKTSKTQATTEFDITNYLHKGRNLYTFKMNSWDEGSESPERQWKPGITSDCYIYTIPMRMKMMPIDSSAISLDSLSVLLDSLRADSIRFANDSIFLADSLAKEDSLEAVSFIPPKVMKVLIADRYTIEPSSGYLDTRSHMLASIRKMKYLNFNAVSYNKASSDPLFIKLCKQNGLRVVEEPPTYHGRLIDDDGQLTYLAYEAIHSNQYINGYAKDTKNGKFIIVNNDTVNQERVLKIDWTLYVDGRASKQGSIPNVEFVSKARKEVALTNLLSGILGDQEALLNLRYYDQKDNAILGFDMFTIRPYNYQGVIANKEAWMARLVQKPKTKVKNKEGALEIFDKNGQYRVAFNAVTGLLTSYEVAGQQYLTALQPVAGMTLKAIDKVKPNKKTGTDVRAVYSRNYDGHLFVMTYHISLTGVLSVSSNVDMELLLRFPAALNCKQYYARDEFRPILSEKLEEETDLVRWCRQSDGKSKNVWLMGEDQYQLKPTQSDTETIVGSFSKDSKLFILPQ